jgi:serine protease Do
MPENQTIFTPTPPSSQKGSSVTGTIQRRTLVAAVILSLLLGTAGGAIGGSFVNSSSGNWLSRIFPSNASSANTSQTSSALSVQEESATIDVVKKVQDSVVSIIGTKDLSKIYNSSPSDIFNFLGFNIPQQPNAQGQQEVSSGSGFILTVDGYIMTNRHVVRDTAAQYTVLMNNGQKYSAKVVAIDPVNDLAVVKVDVKNLKSIEFGDSSSLQIGQTVIAIGNALGQFRNTVTKGVVSGLARDVTAGDGQTTESLQDVIQTDAAINPGNSGGPLLNIAGQVIGVNTAVSESGQLIGFAIPVNQAKQVFESVQKYGRIIRPYLGVRYVPITSALQKQNDLSVDYGVLILRGNTASELAVVPGSPADKAGLLENDIILEINGVKLDSEHSLTTEIQKYKPDNSITLKILSKGKEKTVTVTLAEAK